MDQKFIEISSDSDIIENEFEEVEEVEEATDKAVKVSLVDGEGIIESESDDREEESESDYSEGEESEDECVGCECSVTPYNYTHFLTAEMRDKLRSIEWGEYILGSLYKGLRIIAIPATFSILGFLVGSAMGGQETVNVCRPQLIHVIHNIHHIHTIC